MNLSSCVLFSSLLAALASGCAAPPESETGSDEEVQSAEQNLYMASTKKWPTGTIAVCWEQSGNDTEKAWVKDAVAMTWQRQANVRFTGWGRCSSSSKGIRIRLADENPRTEALGTDIDGWWGGMTLNFTFATWSPDCAKSASREGCIRSIGVHEFGHALGFSHEQNRPDHPATCNQAQGPDGDTTIGDYDLLSVMNYCNPTWNNAGNLSIGDIIGVQTVYGRKLSGSIVTARAKCLDIRGDSLDNGTPIQIYDCKTSASTNQDFVLEDSELKSFGPRCMDIAGGVAADHTPVNSYDCHGGINQLWSMPKAHIRGLGGMSLRVNSNVNGTAVELADEYDDFPAEEWQYMPNGEIRHEGKCMDVRGFGTANGTAVQIYDCNGGANQKFTLLPDGQIQGYGNKCLDVPGSSLTSGTDIQMFTCNSGLNQKWSWAGAIVGQGGYCLDVPGGSTTNGTAMQIFGCNGGANQKFEWYP